MDSVQFPRGTCWLTRNRLKNDQGTLRMTVPVWKKGLGFQKINEVRIQNEGRWLTKHLVSLKTAYRNAPFLEDHLGFLENIFSGKIDKLMSMNLKIITYLMEYMNIPTKLVLLSELGINEKEPRLSLIVCQELGATYFLAQTGAKKFIDKNILRNAGIEPIFFNPHSPVYPQLWGEFIPNLSTLDLVLNCGPKSKIFL